jgi:flagellar motor component MotA/DNA-directed RNA polymerase subunit RPC12/RpoP
MTKDEFTKAYSEFVQAAITLAIKGRRQGLLTLSADVDGEKAGTRDIFHYGLQFAVNGFAPEHIDKILSNIIAQEKDEYERTFKTIQKEAVLGIQAADNPFILGCILNSYTGIPVRDDDWPIEEWPEEVAGQSEEPEETVAVGNKKFEIPDREIRCYKCAATNFIYKDMKPPYICDECGAELDEKDMKKVEL